MFDFISSLVWVVLGVGVLGLAFVEYRFSSKKRTETKV
jgi:NADH/NAD ratio-sensing transcriptional regulator Rex